jgi:hypothetical protein
MIVKRDWLWVNDRDWVLDPGDLDSADTVIDLLGGTNAVAKLFGTSAKAVSNWRTRGLPAHTYVLFSHHLKAKGREAPPALWRQRKS